MKVSEKMNRDFEVYYESRDCEINKMFLTKKVIENIYLRAYADGYGCAVDGMKAMSDENN